MNLLKNTSITKLCFYDTPARPGPLCEFLNVFGYLIENRYRFEHPKSTSC